MNTIDQFFRQIANDYIFQIYSQMEGHENRDFRERFNKFFQKEDQEISLVNTAHH